MSKQGTGNRYQGSVNRNQVKNKYVDEVIGKSGFSAEAAPMHPHSPAPGQTAIPFNVIPTEVEGSRFPCICTESSQKRDPSSLCNFPE